MEKLENFIHRTVNGMHLAAVFSTRLPWPILREYSNEALSRSLWAFPFVGAGIGALAGLVFWAMLPLLPTFPAAFITLGVILLMTGALHEDGLADVADGFGTNGSTERRLAAMRDSRLGTYGVIAIVLSLGLRSSCIAYLVEGKDALLALIAASSGSRSLFPTMLCWLPPARTDGLGASIQRPSTLMAIMTLAIGAAVVILCLGPVRGVLALSIITVSVVLLGMLALRKIGGQTGDVLGCTQQISEIAILLAAVS